MATLPLLKVIFDAQIASWEVPAFRKALLNRIEWDQPTEKNRYPMWQCKTHFHQGRQQALLVSLGEAAEQMVGQLKRMNGTVLLPAGRSVALTIAACRSHTFQLHANCKRHYRLFNYQPFNPTHYQQYISLDQIAKKQELLRQLLSRHVQVFTAGVEWHPSSDLDIQIEAIHREKWISCKGVKVLCFDLTFSGRLFIPEFVGLGRGAGRGFGVVRKGESRLPDQVLPVDQCSVLRNDIMPEK
ncbi:MAG: CRISPR-associated endonuclease Cas6 [Saprospiraceae bacterium]